MLINPVGQPEKTLKKIEAHTQPDNHHRQFPKLIPFRELQAGETQSILILNSFDATKDDPNGQTNEEPIDGIHKKFSK